MVGFMNKDLTVQHAEEIAAFDSSLRSFAKSCFKNLIILHNIHAFSVYKEKSRSPVNI